MDEIVLNNEVESELLFIDNQSIGKEETPSTSLTSDVPFLSEDVSEELSSSDNENETYTLAPDAINEEVPSVNLQTEGTESETLGADLEHNIDDVYTLLSDGVTVKLQSESETESIESESEITLSNIYSKLEETRLLESEALLQINNNVVKANNNDNILGFMSISLLSALLGGIVAIGFLKGLR